MLAQCASKGSIGGAARALESRSVATLRAGAVLVEALMFSGEVQCSSERDSKRTVRAFVLPNLFARFVDNLERVSLAPGLRYEAI